MIYLTLEDLKPFATIEDAKAEAMIEDAEAMAMSVAPCLADDTVELSPRQAAVVRAVLRRAVLRWNDIGTGAVTQQSAGPFAQTVDTTRSTPRSLFWPSEIDELQAVCKQVTDEEPADEKVFTFNTGPLRAFDGHADICSIRWGDPCSCGSDLNVWRAPIPEYFEGGW